MVSALVSRSRGPGSSPEWPGHCAVFLGKTFYSHSSPLSPPRSKWVPANCEGNLMKFWGVTCD